jgi:hypothetical protein
MDLDYSFDEEDEGGGYIGGWMEGDSLAPPCQGIYSTYHTSFSEFFLHSCYDE